VDYVELEEFNTSSIDMGDIGNKPLPDLYYDAERFRFTPAYDHFLNMVLQRPRYTDFNYDFPVVIPQ